MRATCAIGSRNSAGKRYRQECWHINESNGVGIVQCDRPAADHVANSARDSNRQSNRRRSANSAFYIHVLIAEVGNGQETTTHRGKC